MAIPLLANAKTVKEDSALFFAVTETYAVPTASARYRTPRQFNELLRSRLRQRNRFNRDHHDTCMYIARSKNANVVAYTANLVDVKTNQSVESGIGRHCALRKDDPLHPYFVNLEPSYVAERRRKGVEYDCDDLNILERTMAYGVSAAPVNMDGISQYWGRKAPEAFAELQRSWATSGSAAAPEGAREKSGTDDDKKNDGDDSSSGDSDIVKNADAGAGSLADDLTADSLDAALKAWWTPFHPYVSHFVALPTWPGLVLCLPPLSTTDGSHRSSACDASLSRDGTAPTKAASVGLEGTDAPPETVKTCITYGTHTEPSPLTPTTGVLSDEDTVVVIVSLIDGELSVVESVYVSSVEPKRFYQLPKVEYIEVHGTSLATGKPTYEKKSS
ncbi:hypothetical protein ABB37_06383 [Leptomonas pyrrhocoris]|uniref:DUF4833 domain-containing protein n=1 Tax=Leptomonas pyrrhocoris TaxID=157538 RepID=A0A0N0DU14_LEPPY|nr:hypothetical protein ABB37_06383 [Leptomonas pyrrhocoris]KPA78222.1 hypothetical protein ABB37_06383 [Leptomonas pyrrhocoris]|eukprot:XP_015656661.1 hypothetical protein ABB37_06383 [Leptomonas pyrrhocoris]